VPDIRKLHEPIRRIHEQVRDEVLAAFANSPRERLSQVERDGSGDTIYAIDQVSESRLVELFEQNIAVIDPLLLIGEGIGEGAVMLPLGAEEKQAVWRIIVDPLDGTRGLMYQKRSAWILTGVAPNYGEETTLGQVQLAVQTEVPLIKQHLCDTMWATRGGGAYGERFNRVTGERSQFTPQPSRANSIAHGFAMIARFFPGAREELAAIDEEIIMGALGPVRPGKAHCFEDQYICTAGQLYELMVGHDRFVADIRPLMEQVLSRRGLALGICCHPYDLCTELIAKEVGIIVTDMSGDPLNCRLTADEDVAWAGYANEQIRQQIEPLLQKALRRRKLLA